eukprot:gene64375-88041_t
MKTVWGDAMRYRDGRKEQTRERILAAAGGCFRRAGYAGIGVDGLAKEAGVTSGAFYAHFGSKRAAFEAALAGGMQELGAAIAAFRAPQAKARAHQRCCMGRCRCGIMACKSGQAAWAWRRAIGLSRTGKFTSAAITPK